MMDRLVPAGIVEEWMTHLRRQRSRANDMIWLIEQGATLHDGQDGKPLHDATERWLSEQREVVADVNRLEELYKGINERRAHFGRVDPSDEPVGTVKQPARH